MGQRNVLFVCLGNICRSPLGEAIFIHKARAAGVLDAMDIDSAGIGHWHIGQPADPRSIEVGRRHGLDVKSIARQVEASDLERFDLLLAMDRENRRDLLDLGAPESRVRLMRSFDPAMEGVRERELDVPDPYLGGREGFEGVYQMLDAACEGLLSTLDG